MKETPDFIVVGAGIVGLATAWHLHRVRPEAHIAILDKEDREARHQSSHNSGVIHAGVYYKPGSAKAINCRKGYTRLLEFCDMYGIPYRICGKLIAAVEPWEVPHLDRLRENAIHNGLTDLRILSPEEARQYEPHLDCLGALWVPQTGVVDYALVCKHLRLLLEKAGATFHFRTRVTAMQNRKDGVLVSTDEGELFARQAINCAGLYADRLAWKHPAQAPLAVIPFRGEYYLISEEKKNLIQGLIYPVPNPALPFLGVHFTRRINDTVDIGPNAVLAFAREGYQFSSFNAGELFQYLRFPGFWKMASRYWKVGIDEIHRSLSKNAFMRRAMRYCPAISPTDVRKGPAGVRAQAIDRQGKLIDDFYFEKQGHILHCLNVPSPAATSSLAIGEKVAAMALGEKIRS